jgi:hypothetical protein
MRDISDNGDPFNNKRIPPIMRDTSNNKIHFIMGIHLIMKNTSNNEDPFEHHITFSI